MFSTEVDTGANLPAILLQTVAVTIASVVLGFLTVWIPATLSELRSSVARVPEALSLLAFAGGVPYLLARRIARKWPSVVSSGRVVGLFPGLVYIPAVIWSRGEVLAPRIEGADAIIWVVMIVVGYPLLGCMGYSLGMIRSQPDRGYR